MLHMFKPVSLLAVVCASVSFNTFAADDRAEQASEQIPGEETRGVTNDRGPRKYGDNSGGPASSTQRVEVRTEPVVIRETRGETYSELPPAGARYHKIDGHYVLIQDGPAAGNAAPQKVDDDKTAQRKEADAEKRIRAAIRRLGTSGWREAQLEIIEGGKTSVPLLIDAMAGTEETTTAAYNLGGHTKSDSGRATRNRTIAGVCSELLTTLVTQHSNYKGELPTLDQRAWQEWWLANGDRITFGK